jgi:3-hydroxyacyl-CoA dehydrogenase/enoyl-CoA hydratase/3-hydroxybutyryl-CoA epimerase
MTETTKNKLANLGFEDGIATISLNMPKVNKINDDFGVTLQEALAWARGCSGLKGIIITSAHKDFCVGADIDRLYKERDPASLMKRLRELHGLYRSIETIGVPVVAALTGSALGGGYELALACHRRIALNSPKVQLGLPEVSLGVLPGAGGTQRLPRLVGIQVAMDCILQGKIVRAPKAKGIGLCDELADTREGVLAAARTWILANPRANKQPWDQGKPIPGPQPGSNDARGMFMAACGMLTKKTAGAYPAPELAVAAMQEGLSLTFERALEVEARYFTRLATSDQAKDMIRTIWYHRTAAEKHEGLPSADLNVETIGIVGAGMMGAGLAFISAQAGLNVVLKDIQPETLDKAMEHAAQQAKNLRHLPKEQQEAIVARIKPTLSNDDLDGVDMVIEAVFENIDLKHKIQTELEPKLSKTGFWASNTSALPITDLAKISGHKDKFIGMHFFSPVEKMQLLEIITTADTSDETLGRALAYARLTKKLPIVVGDGYGFYTSRVFIAYILEGAQLVSEGHDPVVVEWAARSAGMVVAPLQVFDEVTLSLAVKGFAMGRRYGKTLETTGVALIEKMVGDLDRPGKAAGRGFYDYKDGKRVGIWSELRSLAVGKPDDTSVELLQRRLLGLQAVEAARCVEQGVVKAYRDAEVGAIFGIGFAPNTGGPLSYIDRRGLAAFVAEMDDFAKKYGDRYAPPKLLRDMAAKGETFFERV